MKNDYAFATGAVRAMENGLLPRSFYTALMQAGKSEARRMLIDRGFSGFVEQSDPDAALRNRMQEIYDELLPYLPDRSILNVCILPNDFHNLKVALKGILRGGERRDLYRRPAVFDPDGLWEIVSARDFEALPPFLRDAAREGYEILTETGNGQQMDLELDRRCLTEQLSAAETAGELICRWAKKSVLYANLRVALRLSRQNPGDALIRCALADVPGLDKEALADRISQGQAAVAAFIQEEFDELPDPGEVSLAVLEKAMDDRLTELLSEVRSLPCGPEVPTAYYLFRETERKNVCILASRGDESGAGVPERLRETYA